MEYSSLVLKCLEKRTFQTSNPAYNVLRSLAGCIIGIEGNIGAGKTTFGRTAAKILNEIGIPAIFIEEKVNKDLLKLFYENIGREKNYSFAFQINMLQRCIKNYATAVYESRGCTGPPKVVFIDRAVQGNFVFAAAHRSTGGITDDEFAAYMAELEENGPYIFDSIIYLDVSPESAIKNIRTRNRESEQSCTLEYLKKLDCVYYAHICAQISQNNSKIIVVPNDNYADVLGILRMLVEKNTTSNLPRQITPDMSEEEACETARAGFRMLAR